MRYLQRKKRENFSPAQEWALSRNGDGTEHPSFLPKDAKENILVRTFCFIDIANFTSYTRQEGPSKALTLLERFRSITRQIAAARGVRIAKWLGDGAMLVSVQPGPCIAAAAHLSDYFNEVGIGMRVGISTGSAFIIDGDDYVGEPVNLASKLCSAAGMGEIFANVNREDLPKWVNLKKEISVGIRGIGRIEGILQLEAGEK